MVSYQSNRIILRQFSLRSLILRYSSIKAQLRSHSPSVKKLHVQHWYWQMMIWKKKLISFRTRGYFLFKTADILISWIYPAPTQDAGSSPPGLPGFTKVCVSNWISLTEIHPFYLPAHPIPHLGGPFDLQKQRGRAKESQRCFFCLGAMEGAGLNFSFFRGFFFDKS